MPGIFSATKTWEIIRNRHNPVSIIFNLMLFVVFFSFFKSIYNTSEDVYVLYKLSGGFGDKPTGLVHYNHILHPILSHSLAMLFKATQRINWYTIALVLSHFVACVLIFSRILKAHPTLRSFLFYLALFIVFECRLLAGINFTNTSIILCCAAIVVLNSADKRTGFRFPQVLAIVIMLIASFFRIHVLIPIIGVSLPFLLANSKRSALTNIIVLFASGILIVVFNFVHQYHYEKNIPGWAQEEAYRQKMYRYANNMRINKPQKGEKWYKELMLVEKGIPYDTTYINSQLLTAMYTELTTNELPVYWSREEIKWYLINNRLLFCTILVLILFSGFNRLLLMAEGASLVLLISGSLFLQYIGKLPDYILISCLLLFGFLVLLNAAASLNIRQALAGNILAVLIVCWGIVQLHKMNQKNKEGIEVFRADVTEIQRKKGTLFIACIDFPSHNFYIFDTPGKYPFTNLLTGENFLQNDYQSTFKRFGIRRKQDLYKNDKVEFFYCDSTTISQASN